MKKSLFLSALLLSACGGDAAVTVNPPAPVAHTPEGGAVTRPPRPSAATVYWTAPTTDTNGDPLTLPITEYIIFYGKDLGKLDHSLQVPGTETQYTILGLADGDWYFDVEACDENGCSKPSLEATKSLNVRGWHTN